MPVLVVDDDDRTLRALEEMLALAGYAVRAVHTGEDALDYIERRPPAALITELSLPGMDGLTLARRARDATPELALIILTGAPTARTAAEALRLGVDDYVIKHADTLGHLRATLKRSLRRRSREAETRRLLGELTDLNEQFLDAMGELQRANLELEQKLALPADHDDRFNVLVVDDERSVVLLLETLLNSQPDIRTVGAYSGADARQTLERESFDLVMTDKNLGDASGVDLIGEIHARWPGTAVLVMTGYATLESAVQAMEHGAVAYIQKPFPDLDEVLAKVIEVRDKLRHERDERRYLRDVRARNADFVARYRLLKTKLLTLQREPR